MIVSWGRMGEEKPSCFNSWKKKKKPFFRNCHECSLISMNFSHFWSFPGCLWGQGYEWEEIPLHFHWTSILSLKMRFYRQFLTKSSFIVFLSLQRKTKQPPWPKKTPKCIYIYIYIYNSLYFMLTQLSILP